jgi:hypothetical protein
MLNKPLSPADKVLRASISCGLAALALGLILYTCLVNPPKTLEVALGCWGWLQLMGMFVAGIVWIPIKLMYQTLMNLPLGLQVASLCAWVWCICVCTKLKTIDDAGQILKRMILARRVLLGFLVIIVATQIIKYELEWLALCVLLSSFFAYAIYKEEICKDGK